MKRIKKLVLLGILAILVFSIPATSAQEITREGSLVLECPSNNKVFTGLYFYNNTDYAFDNFTVSYLSLVISADAALEIHIYSQAGGTGYNTSWHLVLDAVTHYCEVDIFDLQLDDEVFNATTYPFWSRDSTQEISGLTYSVVFPYFLIEIENIDSVDAVVHIDYLMMVETHGDREVELIITPRNTTEYSYLTPVEWVDDGDPYPSELYWILDLNELQTLSLVFLTLGGCIGALVMLLSKRWWN